MKFEKKSEIWLLTAKRARVAPVGRERVGALVAILDHERVAHADAIAIELSVRNVALATNHRRRLHRARTARVVVLAFCDLVVSNF